MRSSVLVPLFSFDQQGLVDDPSGGSDGGEQQSGVMNELEDKDGGSGEKKSRGCVTVT